MAEDKPQMKHPLLLWAQRADRLYLTVEVPDIKVEEIKIDGDKLHLKCTSSGQIYDAQLELFDKLNGEYQQTITRHLDLVMHKEESKWWPRLLKISAKVPWIKIDFNKWKDEDENEAEEDQFSNVDFSNFDLPSAVNDNFDEDLSDDDEDEMPPLESTDKEEKNTDVDKPDDAKEEKEVVEV